MDRPQGAREDDGPRDGLLRLGDGRQITYRSFGDPRGDALIALHGTPGSRLKFSATHAAACALGLNVIAPDRWGYGGSSMPAKPSLGAYAADVAALADQLGLGQFSLFGVSGGGPYAAVTAALLAERVTALALVAPVGPIHGEADGEISRFHRFCFGQLARTPAAVGLVFGAFRWALAIAPNAGMRLAMVRIAAVDQDVLRQPETRRRLGATFIEGLRPGVNGPITDLALFGQPWCVDAGNFAEGRVDLARAAMPARLWLGTHDQNVPRSAARRLASRLGACDVVDLEGQGHLWIANNYGAVLAWVREALDGRSLGAR